MDIKQLKAFLTVAETGNVTKAADVLHLVQPAVSRQVRLLEEDLGTRLFDRERHGMVLTQAGKALAVYARRAMLELDRARAEVSEVEQPVRGLVTLGMLPSSVDLLASPLASAVSTELPGVRLRLAMGYVGTLMSWLESGEVDAALLYGSDRWADIETRPLIQEPLWVVGPPGCRLRAGRPVALAELASEPMLLPSAPHGIRTLVDHACAVAGVELNVAVETNALGLQRSLVLGGHGLTILPPTAVASELRQRRLKGAPLMPAITRTIVVAQASRRPIGRHVREVLKRLDQEARRAVDSGRWLEGRWAGGRPAA